MVSFKFLLLGAAAVVGVMAQSDADAAAYWAQSDDAADGTPPAKRDLSFAHMPRGDIVVDPYAGYHCRPFWESAPCGTNCNRNNCFRSFLNARDGSDGKHCPIEAFAFCCKWNKAPYWAKAWAVHTGLLYSKAPYTKNCKGSGDNDNDVIGKIDDVCGCTLDHNVTLDISQNPAYWALRWCHWGDKKCH